jgi:TolB-like protein
MAVYGSDGKKIGEINRVLGDGSNTAKAVAVDAGGFLGMGTHEVVFPLDKLSKGSEKNHLSTSLTKDEIKNLEAYKTK